MLTLNYQIVLNNAHQERNIDTICASVTSTALQLNPFLHTRAQQVADRFSKAFKLFGKCHNVFDKNYVSDGEIEELGKCDTSEDAIQNTLFLQLKV